MGILSKIFTWWDGATIGTSIYSWRKGKAVGADALGKPFAYRRFRNGTSRDRLASGTCVQGKCRMARTSLLPLATLLAPSGTGHQECDRRKHDPTRQENDREHHKKAEDHLTSL
jgi:hypothetical protein